MSYFLERKLFVVFLFDVIVLAVGFWGAYALRVGSLQRFFTITIQPITVYLVPGVVVIALCVFSLFLSRLYEDRRYLSRLEQYANLVKAMSYGILCSFGLSFFMRAHNYSRGVLLLFWMFGTIGLVVERALWHRMLKYFRRRGKDCLPVAVLGMRGHEHKVETILSRFPELGYRPIASLNIGSGSVTQHLRRLEALVASGKLRGVLVGAPARDYHRVVPYLAWCEEHGILHHRISSQFEAFHGEQEVEEILRVEPKPLFIFGKKLFDEAVALIIMVLTAPLWALIVVAIKLDSPGPVFFVQERVGRHGRTFNMFKFRTMFVHAPRYALTVRQPRDSRVSRVGRCLRRTSLDELPQLLNVLRGEMSLVGPRPEMPFMVKKNSLTYQKRLLVLPGVTGLWQAVARHEPLEESLRYDLYYIKNRSFVFDLIILVRTLITIVSGRGAS